MNRTKCDKVLAALETGGPVGRVLARIHVRRCAACARAVQHLAEFKRAMAEREPVSESDRRVWLSASRRSVPAVRGAAAGVRRGALAAAVVVLIGAALFFWWRSDDSSRKSAGGSPPGIDEKQDPAPEPVLTQLADSTAFDGLHQGLADLAHELDQLAHTVSLLDERREIELLLSRERTPLQ